MSSRHWASSSSSRRSSERSRRGALATFGTSSSNFFRRTRTRPRNPTPRLSSVASPLALGARSSTFSAAELAFTRSEAVELLRGEFSLELPEQAIGRDYSRTGGWPAGLRLAAAFVSERGWQQLGEFQGGGAQLYAYFNTEVLRRASRRDQNTILRWSLLDRIEDDVRSRPVAPRASFSPRSSRPASWCARRGREAIASSPLRRVLRSRARELLPAARSSTCTAATPSAPPRAEMWTARSITSSKPEIIDARRSSFATTVERALQGSEVATLQRWLDGFPPGAERRLPWVILLRGLLHRVRGDYERALANYRDAAGELRRGRDTEGLARALTWSAQALRYLRRPQEAIEQAQEALGLVGEGASSQSAGSGTSSADRTRTSARSRRPRVHTSRLKRSSRSSRIAPASSPKRSRSPSWHHLLGEFDAAQRTYLRALALQQKNADITPCAGPKVDWWTCGPGRGDTAEALDTLRQTLEIASANDLRLAQAAMCSTLMTVTRS